MTFVEFFDKASVRNICSCLAHKPDRVIFIGNNKKLMKKYIPIYHGIFAGKGKNIDFSCRSVPKNDIDEIIKALCEIVEESSDVVIDIDGGEDVMLMATGVVFEKYRERNIKLQRVNVASNTLRVGDSRELVFSGLTVPEYIRLYGGNVIFATTIHEGTRRWKYDHDFKADIELIWNICRRDPSLWNRETKDLQVWEKHRIPAGDPLFTKIPKSTLEAGTTVNIMNALVDAGLILDYSETGKHISYRYKNDQVKRCLTKSGQALEMKIYSVARELRDEKNHRVYDDVMNGVCIDWDGEAEAKCEGIIIENEIDVMLTKGAVPVFISCKNGQVDVNELYKLNTVAQRFGGEYAKKVLVTTSLDRSGEAFASFFRDRADSMDIRLLENVQFMSESELEKAIKNMWRT